MNSEESPEKLGLENCDINSILELIDKETQINPQALVQNSEGTVKTYKLPLPRDLQGNQVECCLKLFSSCKVIQDPDCPKSVTIVRESVSQEAHIHKESDKEGVSNRYRYCKEVIKPYLKDYPPDCPDSGELLIKDAIDVANEDFPEYPPCFEIPDPNKEDDCDLEEEEEVCSENETSTKNKFKLCPGEATPKICLEITDSKQCQPKCESTKPSEKYSQNFDENGLCINPCTKKDSKESSNCPEDKKNRVCKEKKNSDSEYGDCSDSKYNKRSASKDFDKCDSDSRHNKSDCCDRSHSKLCLDNKHSLDNKNYNKGSENKNCCENPCPRRHSRETVASINCSNSRYTEDDCTSFGSKNNRQNRCTEDDECSERRHTREHSKNCDESEHHCDDPCATQRHSDSKSHKEDCNYSSNKIYIDSSSIPKNQDLCCCPSAQHQTKDAKGKDNCPDKCDKAKTQIKKQKSDKNCWPPNSEDIQKKANKCAGSSSSEDKINSNTREDSIKEKESCLSRLFGKTNKDTDACKRPATKSEVSTDTYTDKSKSMDSIKSKDCKKSQMEKDSENGKKCIPKSKPCHSGLQLDHSRRSSTKCNNTSKTDLKKGVDHGKPCNCPEPMGQFNHACGTQNQNQEQQKKRALASSSNLKVCSSNSLMSKIDMKAHTETVATIKCAMEDFCCKIFRTTQDAVSCLASEGAKQFENFRKPSSSSDCPPPKKVCDSHSREKLRRLSLVNIEAIPDDDRDDGSLTPTKVYNELLKKVSSTISLLSNATNFDLIVGLKPTSFNDTSSKYDKPLPEILPDPPKEVENVINTAGTSNMFDTFKDKIFSLFGDITSVEDDVSAKDASALSSKSRSARSISSASSDSEEN